MTEDSSWWSGGDKPEQSKPEQAKGESKATESKSEALEKTSSSPIESESMPVQESGFEELSGDDGVEQVQESDPETSYTPPAVVTYSAQPAATAAYSAPELPWYRHPRTLPLAGFLLFVAILAIVDRHSPASSTAGGFDEIEKRVTAAGGRTSDVDIRASLMWNDRDDLDLHCRTPEGVDIWWHNKFDNHGGALDVDQNVQGETTTPVENVRWPKGQAPPGQYVFWVENYAYHEPVVRPIPYRAEIDVQGHIQHIEGVMPPGATGVYSAQRLFEITYPQQQQ